MAGNHTGRKLQRRRFRTETGAVHGLHGTGRVGGSDVGPNGLQFRQNRERVLPDRSLRKLPEVFGVGEYSGVAGGVHAGGFGLLRREPGRRVQLAGGRDPHQRQRELQRRRLRRGFENHVSVGAGTESEREDGGLPECLRRFQHRRVLLPRGLWESDDLPAYLLFQEV